MTKIYLLTDYKGGFGSKLTAVPYRSGFDKPALEAALEHRGLEPIFLPLSRVDFRTLNLAGQYVVYTSSEDEGQHYKSYIEDVVLGLQLQGARLIPRFECLRAHHNKVFMEMLRDLTDCPDAKSLKARYFGTLEDLYSERDSIRMPAVVKPAAGSMSEGVTLARTRVELVRSSRTASGSHRLGPRARDFARRLRRRGYRPESWHRRKFIVQDFVPGLEHDWKVLVYGSKLYVLRRGVRAGDFRASGSYIFSWPDNAPSTVLDTCWKLSRALDVPWLSVDVASVGDVAHVIEFQTVYFGTIAIEGAPGYYTTCERGWEFRRAASVLEEEFAQAVVEHVQRDGASLREV